MYTGCLMTELFTMRTVKRDIQGVPSHRRHSECIGIASFEDGERFLLRNIRMPRTCCDVYRASMRTLSNPILREDSR